LENLRHIIIFDGKCNLCNSSVNFIIKRDRKALFLFTPLQSEVSQGLMCKYKIEGLGSDSIVLIKNEKVYQRAEAVFEICKDLNGYYFLLRIFRIFPTSLTDFLYNLIADNRYKIFGEKAECTIPSEEVNSRFLIDPL